MNLKTISIIAGMTLSLGLQSCGGNDAASFSLLEEEQEFFQSAQTTNTKIDVLWVVDNSGSMETSQQNLADNFQAFIQNFQNNNYDFKLAVTTTDSWLALMNQGQDRTLFVDGSDDGIDSRVLTQNTSDLNQKFLENVLVGTSGYGDERAFQSLWATLEDDRNSSFIREDAFLAVIIVSDEDDFSHNGAQYLQDDYDNPALHKISNYVSYLKEKKSKSTGVDQFSVSAMAIFDEACHAQLTNTQWQGRKIAQRYAELVDATKGTKGSLCGNFADELKLISDTIIELATKFELGRLPKVDSIKVVVNDTDVPLYNPEAGVTNGWSYEAESNSIVFHGSSVPSQDARVRVTFDPVGFGI